jgi:hypothetical protein
MKIQFLSLHPLRENYFKALVSTIYLTSNLGTLPKYWHVIVNWCLFSHISGHEAVESHVIRVHNDYIVSTEMIAGCMWIS